MSLDALTDAMLWYNWTVANKQEKSETSEEKRREARGTAQVLEEALNLLHKKGVVETLSPLESMRFSEDAGSG